MQTQRDEALALARLVGHLLHDGSISELGQGRVNVGQALDREAVLRDVELLTGKRPAANAYDERKWSIALPADLTANIAQLDGMRVGRRINQTPTLPAFVVDDTRVRSPWCANFWVARGAPTATRLRCTA